MSADQSLLGEFLDRLDLKQANGAELWAKIVASGLIGSGPTRLSLVGERFGEG